MNILPILGSRWILNNCTQSGLSFTFTGAGSARVYFMESDIKAFAPGTLTAFVFPEGLSQLVDIKCNIHIRTGAAFNTHSCFLVSNEESIYEALINLKTGSYDEAFFEIVTSGACSIQQVSLDIITQSFDEVIEELKSELPKLLDDYNTYTIELTNEEVTVGLITANLLENTDLQGHFTLSFLASNKAEIVLRIYDDQRKCLYSPSVVSVNAGKHTIGFPHSYLRSKIGYHNFYVTLQATMGTVKIPTRAMLYTIDGAHMAERLLDSFYVINDITAKTSATSVEPTLLYTVGVVDNLATIRHIEPNQIGVSNWTVDFVVPNVKEAAIEFDGIYNLTVEAEKWSFVSDEFPSLFWTDDTNVLWYQYYDNATTRQQLATDVVTISVCRAWNSLSFPEQDMGLIIAYIKTDGSVYYRTRQGKALGTPVWESEEYLEEAETGNTRVHVHRLNDYRIGFSVTGCNKHFITKRTTIGAGAAPQSVFLNSFGNVSCSIHFEKSDFESEAFYVVSSNRVSATQAIIEFNYPIWFQDDDTISNVRAETPSGIDIKVKSYYSENKTLYLETEFLSIYSNLIVIIPATSSMTYGQWSDDISSIRFVPSSSIVVEGDGVLQNEAVRLNATITDFIVDYKGLSYVTHQQMENVSIKSCFVEFEVLCEEINFVGYTDDDNADVTVASTFMLFTINHNYVGSEPL